MRNEVSVEQGDARALQLRLYRELGVAAVAIALERTMTDAAEMLPVAHTPAIVTAHKLQDIAA